MSLSSTRFSVRKPILGEGSYAIVYTAVERSTERAFAAKAVYFRTDEYYTTYKTEKAVFLRLGLGVAHPYIVQCHEVYIQSATGVFILDQLSRHTLEDVGPMKCDSDVLYCTRQLVSALKYLHEKGIAVRDLKAENVAYDAATKTCTLFDFGLSRIIEEGGCSEIYCTSGSPVFMAPEVLLKRRHNPFLADLWALGQVIYEMKMGRAMFGYCRVLDDLTNEVLVVYRGSGIGPLLDSAGVNEPSRSLIQGLCEYDPARRWSLEYVGEVCEGRIKVEL